MTSKDELERAQDGDIDAFASFYDQHVDGVIRWFARRTASGDVAADLSAETFAAALAALGSYARVPGKGPGAWLYGIARNQLRHWWRSERVAEVARSRLRIDVEPFDDLDLVELRADLERLTGPLRSALATLSPGLREAVVLRVADELPYDEVADRLGCSDGAARVRVSRGLSQLLDHLGAELTDDGDDPDGAR